MRRRNQKGRRKETEAAYAEMACASATQETGSSLKRSWVPLFDFDVTQYQTLILCTFKKQKTKKKNVLLSHGPNAKPRPN